MNEPRPSTAFTTPAWRVAAWMLLGLAASYLAYGLAGLVAGTPIDGSMRWREVQYILRHIAPVQVADELNEHGFGILSPPTAEQAASIEWKKYDPAIGANVGMYPPWSYPPLMLFFVPPLRFAKLWYALCLTGALGFIVWYAYATFRERASATAAFVMVAAVLAVSGIGGSLKIGQVTLLCVAALMALAWLDAHGRRRPVLGGLLFAFSLMKPTIALPFGIPLLIRGRLLTLFIAGMLVVGFSAVTWAMTSVDPRSWLKAMHAEAAGVIDTGVLAPVRLLLAAGLSKATALNAIALGGVAGGIVLGWCWRRSPLSVHFVIASLMAWFWAYHKAYDTPMLIPLLIETGLLACRRPGRVTMTTFIVVGITLWLPFRVPGVPRDIDVLYRNTLQLAQLIVWPLALAILLWHEPRDGSTASPNAV